MENKFCTKVVIGSWKAYNECNKRCLGSQWLDMSDFDDSSEIYDELKKEGFTEAELEETFVQDYESDVSLIEKGGCDYVSAEQFFNLVKKFDGAKSDADTLNAIEDALCHDDMINAIDSGEEENFYFYKGKTLRDVAIDLVAEEVDEMKASGIPNYYTEKYSNCIDYDKYARDYMSDCYRETNHGVLRNYN